MDVVKRAGAAAALPSAPTLLRASFAGAPPLQRPVPASLSGAVLSLPCVVPPVLFLSILHCAPYLRLVLRNPLPPLNPAPLVSHFGAQPRLLRCSSFICAPA